MTSLRRRADTIAASALAEIKEAVEEALVRERLRFISALAGTLGAENPCRPGAVIPVLDPVAVAVPKIVDNALDNLLAQVQYLKRWQDARRSIAALVEDDKQAAEGSK